MLYDVTISEAHSQTNSAISTNVATQFTTKIIEINLPIIWSLLSPTLFSVSLEKAGPKHSTSVPFSVEVAVPFSVDENEVALVPNPVPGVAVNALEDPQGIGELAVLCITIHSMLSSTLQRVTPSMSPVTVHLKVKVSPGQVGKAAMSCAVT